MNIRRILYIACSTFIAIGLLVVVLTTLSAKAEAHEATLPILRGPDEITVDRWRVLADLQFGLGSPGVVSFQNKIHVVSGFYSPGTGDSSSTQAVYDPLTNSWQYLWNIFPVPRSDLVVANVGDKLFAIGGWDSNSESVYSYTHKYEPVLNQWFTMTSMTTPVSGAGGVVISDSIYIIGGWDGITSTKSVQIYNTISDTWSSGTPLPKGRSELKAVLLNGLIYAIGGNRTDSDPNPSTNVVEIYDLASDNWTNGPSLPDSRASMAAVVRQGRIYVIGGTDAWGSGTFTDTNYIFDPGSGLWSSGDPMTTARSAVGAAVISDTIYVIGGVGDPGAGTANEAFADFPISPSFTSIVSDSPDPSQANQPLVVSYVVTSQTDIPTGVVTVTTDLNTLQCSQPLVSGMGSCEFSFDTPGMYTITASYGGDSFHSTSSATASHTVVKANSTTSLVADVPDPSLNGKPISVTFEVTSTYGLPTGAVTVTAGNSPYSCSDVLTGGMGSCGLLFDTPGVYTLTATYSGDQLHSGSSDIESHSVIMADTTMSLTGDEPDPSLVGHPISITFSVTSTYGMPPGIVTVTVSSSPVSCSTALVAGQGSCEITLDAQGTYTITADYGGDITYASSSDSTLHSVVEFLELYLPIILRGQ